ncbi:hypothetical protein Tco_0174972 [Tanacetum coccineum]
MLRIRQNSVRRPRQNASLFYDPNTSSSPSLPISETRDYSLEEFADELAHFTFPPEIDYLPFDAEFDLRVIEYLLNYDPIKEIDSILEDSVDSFDDNLIDTIYEMFTDEYALDYSSPPLWDDYDDELFDLEIVNDDTYDDLFYSKEEKIKDSKILIDELEPPRSSDFLPFLECDLVFYPRLILCLRQTTRTSCYGEGSVAVYHWVHDTCRPMSIQSTKDTGTDMY